MDPCGEKPGLGMARGDRDTSIRPDGSGTGASPNGNSFQSRRIRHRVLAQQPHFRHPRPVYLGNPSLPDSYCCYSDGSHDIHVCDYRVSYRNVYNNAVFGIHNSEYSRSFNDASRDVLRDTYWDHADLRDEDNSHNKDINPDHNKKCADRLHVNAHSRGAAGRRSVMDRSRRGSRGLYRDPILRTAER